VEPKQSAKLSDSQSKFYEVTKSHHWLISHGNAKTQPQNM